MDDKIDVGEKIRTFLRQVFGSRLTNHLEEELLRLREDYETRLRDRQMYEADLKAEIEQLKSKIAQYELVLIPLTSGGLLGPKRTPVAYEEIPPNSWQAEQAAYYKKQEQEEQAESTT